MGEYVCQLFCASKRTNEKNYNFLITKIGKNAASRPKAGLKNK